MRIIIAAFLLAFLAGCASVQHKPLSTDAITQLKGRTLSRATYPKADFVAMSPGAAAFGQIGAAVMISEGAKISKESDLQDPPRTISAGLAEKLAAAHGMRMAVVAAAESSSDEVAALAAAHSGAQYVLDVKTFNWTLAYYPTNWAGYRLMYSARMRLIDTASKSVVSETMCQTTQGDDKNPPSKDQLLANQAALLKEYVDKAARGCIDVLSRDVLKL